MNTSKKQGEGVPLVASLSAILLSGIMGASMPEISIANQKGQLTLLPQTGKSWKWLAIRSGILLAAIALFVLYMVAMPGKSYSGPPVPASLDELQSAVNLRKDVTYLAGTIGERNLYRYKGLQDAAQYIEKSFQALGYAAEDQEYVVEGLKAKNISVEIKGASLSQEIVVVGAHYDSVYGSPGADDNGSGVAALLEIARQLQHASPARTIRLVAFVNEEPPNFQTSTMGSWVYAKRSHQRNENIVAAISLETLGMYTDAPDSQHYPPGFSSFFPSKGNFIGFVGNLSSRPLVRDSLDYFRKTTQFPSEGVAAPGGLTGIGWSDHWSFWQEGYPGIMITDTAPFRNPNYHKISDKPETLNYEPMARVVIGVSKLVKYLGK
jgi:Zn-dependent M28 family amino/carboxypeptidase